MKKSIVIFAAAIVLAMGTTVYGWVLVDGQIGEAVLTEETITGDRAAADGLTAGFRADSSDKLHWINRFDYAANETESVFKRGEMEQKADPLVYDEIRFIGWSTAPFATRLEYDRLEGLQDREIQAFYDEIQQRVVETGAEEQGKVRLRDYLDYYPVSFSFQFGTKLFNSEHALTGLKVYDGRGKLSSESGSAYDDDVDLYAALQSYFKVPVIENEYQTYRVYKVEKYDRETALGYETEIEKPLGAGEDFYEFDPVIMIQEENVVDGQKWTHPDLDAGLAGGEAGDKADDAGEADEAGDAGDAGDVSGGKSASDYNLKNRMLFVVNNRTAKGVPVDLSQIRGGFGVYELPIEVSASATVRRGKRSYTVPDPKPLQDELKMVYPLDEEAEYVEISLSGDHRYLAVFSVKDGMYFVDMVDADTWKSKGPMEVFPASEKMTYAWGEDGTLAATNHAGHVAVLARTEDENAPYKILYSGKIGGGLDQALFDTEMVSKEHSYAKYQYGVDKGLAAATKDGKAALVQNLLAGDPEYNIRNAALACAVIDKSGVIYSGRLKSNIVDLAYDMSEEELQTFRALQAGLADGGTKGEADAEAVKYTIRPVRNENWCRWK